jgi:16S rRNA (cytosine1402-N4)-methyltransferase
VNVDAHTTVLLDEAVSALRIRESGIYVDCTFGRGGHSQRILSQLGQDGRLIAIDRDVDAIESAADIAGFNDKRFSLVHAAMRDLGRVLDEQGITTVDGVLADLGVSSPQLDDANRGFSFRFDAPLDMRMDQSQGETAAAWLDRADEKEIGEVIWRYGEERFARQIARKIVATRGSGRLWTTGELAKLVGETVRTREPGFNPATRTFQALRIFINQELEEVETMLPQAVQRLRVGGRLVVLSFHSLEDRIVKHFMQQCAKKDSLPPNFPVRADEVDESTLVLVGRAQKASAAEVAANPRARSVVMRVAERNARKWQNSPSGVRSR